MPDSVPEQFFISNGQSKDIKNVFALSMEAFQNTVMHAVEKGWRISALFAQPIYGCCTRLWAILSENSRPRILPLCADTDENSFPSMTPLCPQVHLFEREIYEQWGLLPNGHPWLKPIRFSPSYKQTHHKLVTSKGPEIGITDFFQVAGEEIHEVAVGPVHAGIIEPGHFRFQCHGEDVLHLEISLGYQHRGVEKRFVGGPDNRTIHYIETLSGDTSIGHAMVYCQTIESLTNTHVSNRTMVVRGILLELERIANHTGDMGALAGDVGFLPTSSYCGRIRGDILNMTGLICGNRFGRGILRPGSVCFDIDTKMTKELLIRLDNAEKDLSVAINLLWKAYSVMTRFEGTGTITQEVAELIGLVGPAARACGIKRDVRQDMPEGIFCSTQIPVSTWNTGDVLGRARVRWLEIQRSITFIREQLQVLPTMDDQLKSVIHIHPIPPNRLAISMVEGWRGEICHVALTDDQGRFAAYKIVDPSFHNWFGLSLAMRNQQISDFPLCNKSFNLSYCGHDL